MATTELKRTISSAGSQTKWGASAWVKLSGAGTIANTQAVYCSSKSDTTANLRGIMINSDYRLQVAFYDGGYSFQVETNRLLRDPSGFYHLCVAYDSSESTAADRIKMYVNGVLETSFSTSSYPAQNSTHNFFGTDITQLVGSLREGSTICNPCVISHLHVTDGYCYPASSYGSTDAITGEWKINTSPSVSYGTNGFFVLKDDAALTDRSGQGNNLTLGSGTLTKTEDNPSNVFATFNPMWKTTDGTPIYTNSNNTVRENQNKFSISPTTLGMTKGKFYFEAKYLPSQEAYIGVIAGSRLDSIQNAGQTTMGNYNNSWGLYPSGDMYHNNGTGTGFSGTSYTSGDIVQVALDMDNKKVYWGKNGTWMNSGDPTSGSTGTGALTVTDDTYFFGISVNYDGVTTGAGHEGGFECNFGNGYFGTTAVASAGTNASGIGIFEYDVPTGYTALSTKGLNE